MGSTESNPEDEREAQSAESADERGFGASREDGVRLVRAFVTIRSPERRRAVMEYAAEQARLDMR